MSETAATSQRPEPTDASDAYLLSPQQIYYFETFGYLKLPGYFADDIDEIIEGFEDVFRDNPALDTNVELHGMRRRTIIPDFIAKSPRLAPLQHDPRVVGVVRSLIGEDYEWTGCDGNLFYCESYWHPDTYAAPLDQYHVKLSLYLDPIDGESGAIRMIPGSHFHTQTFGKTLRQDFDDPTIVEELYGVAGSEIPSVVVCTEPGDLVIWNFRTIHGSYKGNDRRRLFSLNFRERVKGSHDGPNLPICRAVKRRVKLDR